MSRRLVFLVLSAALLGLGCTTESTPGGTTAQSTGSVSTSGPGGTNPPQETGTAATSAPAEKPIELSGLGSKNTKPFVMFIPARVDLTFSGSGNFISNLTPVDGDALSGVSLSNTIGSTKLTTFVYDMDLDGTKVYADVIGSSGKWTMRITANVPAPASVPATFSGKWGLRTAPVHLSGDFTVTYSHRGDGNFIVHLVPVEGDFFGGESIANEIGKVAETTEVYGVDGDYYIDLIAGGAWEITIKPQT